MLDIVHFIRYIAKTHSQFRNFVQDLEDIIPSDVNYYCIIRRLTLSDVLKMFVDINEAVCTIFFRKMEDSRTTGRH